ncbi:winged helix-turn-helix transcriptional regulator [Kitasatospora sp. NPDC048407]|uniref:winged helix-turn-helix transcriptional regulator n=1 Tax=Kitasatospora sp. NPDC048407 TaxID=3364051 RepID=UPI00371F69AC
MTISEEASVFDLRKCAHRSPIQVGDKWSGAVLRCLQDGPHRFTELKARLRGVNPKVLTETLRAMERDHWLTRTDHGGNPPHVEYALTEVGGSLIGVLDTACTWAREHQED